MKLSTVIKKEKNKLIKRAQTKGLYENFGVNEVMKLEDRFIDISDYSDEMNRNRLLLKEFEDWCMNYCG